MTRWISTALLLTAGSAESVREQLGLSPGDPVQPLDVDQLPLTSDVRTRLRRYAATFVHLQLDDGRNDASIAWGEQGLALASALAGEAGPDVQFRYIVHSPAWAGALTDPVAGLFEDVLMLPPIPVSNGWTAYRSTLSLEFDRRGELPEPPGQPWLTASQTDATDEELRELRRRAVDPVIRSLLAPDELAAARIIVYRQDGTPEISLWLEVGGEEMQDRLWHPEYSGQDSPEPVDVAAHLTARMEDWVCETRFAWGQHRLATYEVPPAH